jgi:hypothetical protein
MNLREIGWFSNITLSVIVLIQHPLWREDGSVIYNCCWSSPVQSYSGQCPMGLMTTFYCLRFETPSTWRAFMTTWTLWGRLSTRCLNVSGGMAAHSSCRAVARAVSDVGFWGLERSRHSNSSFYRIQVKTLGWPVHFWNIIVHKPFPHIPWFMAGSIVILIQTIVNTGLVV